MSDGILARDPAAGPPLPPAELTLLRRVFAYAWHNVGDLLECYADEEPASEAEVHKVSLAIEDLFFRLTSKELIE